MDDDTKKVIQALMQDNERLKRDLLEYYRVEQVLIAAGAMSREKFDQAHEIVRELQP